jgi:hypothetical protein
MRRCVGRTRQPLDGDMLLVAAADDRDVRDARSRRGRDMHTHHALTTDR